MAHPELEQPEPMDQHWLPAPPPEVEELKREATRDE